MNILKLKLHFINKTSAVLLADHAKISSRLISNPVNTLKISQDTIIGRLLNLFLFQTLFILFLKSVWLCLCICCWLSSFGGCLALLALGGRLSLLCIL